MAQFPTLFPTLQVDGYTLTMIDRPSDNYKVLKKGEDIGTITFTLECVKAYNGTETFWIPYDVRIDVVRDTEDLPIQLFKKVILATATTLS